jgi:hypothetical protein
VGSRVGGSDRHWEAESATVVVPGAAPGAGMVWTAGPEGWAMGGGSPGRPG